MKSLLILIILLVVTVSSFDINSIDPSHWESDEGFEHHKCWSKDSELSYYTEFALNAVNTVYPTPKGIEPVTFSEGGVISTDFKSQQMYLHFGVVSGNFSMCGQYWGFGSNSTSYFIDSKDNSTCRAFKLMYPFPKTMPKFKKVGETKLGQVDVDVYIIKNQKHFWNYTKQCTLIQKGTCIPMSSNIGNADRSIKGFGLMNFYKYEEKARHDKFQLPSICYNAKIEEGEEEPIFNSLNSDDYFENLHKNIKGKHHANVNQDDSVKTKTTTKTSTKTTTISTDAPSQHHKNTPTTLDFHHLF